MWKDSGNSQFISYNNISRIPVLVVITVCKKPVFEVLVVEEHD
jgi:hypothetical protein